ncbi:hypothetical protein KSS87_020493, partial [Heliosperma pusillum]
MYQMIPPVIFSILSFLLLWFTHLLQLPHLLFLFSVFLIAFSFDDICLFPLPLFFALCGSSMSISCGPLQPRRSSISLFFDFFSTAPTSLPLGLS